MPANQRQSKSQAPSRTATSPNSKAPAKYTNKDGSKFITVPSDINNSAMAQTSVKPNGHLPAPPADTNGVPTVNRKKQKRREKQAAKLAAEAPVNSIPPSHNATSAQTSRPVQNHSYGNNGFDAAEGEQDYLSEDDGAYSGSYGHNDSPPNGYAYSSSHGKKSKKTKKGKGSDMQAYTNGHMNGLSHNHHHGHMHSTSLELPAIQPNMPRGPGISREKIWNTSTNEERERIKQYWLSLGEEDRKSLVKVEKDAVLKKMKEQQRHSCSCTVCGRKRTAIEEELEVLYDAYYEELEQYAHIQGPSPISASRRFGAMSGLQPPNLLPPSFNRQPSRGRIMNGGEPPGDDEADDGEEEYSEDEGDEDEEYSDDEPEEPPRNSHATDFFNFGNSLTVQGGILTVADDLLKNDGKKFIEMMEQLAERRMAREESAHEQKMYPSYHTPNGLHPHSHPHTHAPPPLEEEDDDYGDEDEEEEEEDEEYDSGEEFEEEETDTMTEAQRMEEGRRMFQIFAARMFEQRVLTAYRETVASQRQQKLLEELEEENRADSLKKAKKAKDAQKKKEKAAQKKQALAEEKAKKDSEKAAEEAALRVMEEKKAEEQRRKAEEKRKRKDALKKAEEEDRLRKEAEKQKRLQQERERQADKERKEREIKEKERKEKEELRQKEREAKEAKEREAKERREKIELEKREREASLKAAREAKEQQQLEEKAQHLAKAAIAATQAVKRAPVPMPAKLQPTVVASPLVPIALPVVPKAPTPVRLRTTSQQDSSASSSVPQTPQTSSISQNVSPVPSTPLQGSPGPIGPPGKQNNHQPFLHHPQATSPMHSALKGPPGMQPHLPFGNMQPMPFLSGPQMLPGFAGRIHEPMFPHQPLMNNNFRPLPGPGGIPLHSMHPNNYAMQQGRGGFPGAPLPPPGFPQSPSGMGAIGLPFGKETGVSHSRHHSGSYENTMSPQQHAQPIARPVPIGRPSSIVHGQRNGSNTAKDIEDLSNHLGSSALLDDAEDEPLEVDRSARRASAAPRHTFPPPPFGMDQSAFASPVTPYNTMNTWGSPFGASSLPGSSFMGGSGGWPQSTATSFSSVAVPPRAHQPRPVAIRLSVCQVCRALQGTSEDGYLDVAHVRDEVNATFPHTDVPVSELEILEICETEGSPNNGGGSFDIRKDAGDRHSILYEAEVAPRSSNQSFGAPGDIGSPVVGGARFGPPGF